MQHYSQLTFEQRYQIYTMLNLSQTQSAIAEFLGVNKSTISRELSRNTGGRGYRPIQAHRFALERRDEKVRTRISDEDWLRVEQLIEEDWSPQQISLWLAAQAQEPSISHESIYQYIYWDKSCGGELHTHLRCQKKRKKRYGRYDRRGSLVNQVSIDDRPAVVDERLREGDWEVDTIIGKNHKQAIVSITERTLRLTYLEKVETKDAKSVAAAIVKRLRRSDLPVLTITADNGREFGLHEKIAHKLNADFYFAHPYCSWERGANENSNGLVRQYLPKGTDFTTVTQSDLRRIERRLNNRPRLCLDMQTPNQVAFGLTPSVALGI